MDTYVGDENGQLRFPLRRGSVTAAKLVPLEPFDAEKLTNDAILFLVFRTNWPFDNRARNMT